MTTLFFLLFLSFYFLFSTSAIAQCPVCIVTVGSGMLLAKKLGVDDLIVSIWISALNTAIAFWIAPKIKIKFLKNPYFISLILLLSTLIYFQFTDQLNGLDNKFFGLNKIIFGQTLGLILIITGNYIYHLTKHNNNHKTIFPYAKVVFPVGLILVATAIFKIFFKL